MTVKKVLGECLIKMGKENFAIKTEYDDEEIRLLKQLLSALNIVYREIISEYLPLVETEEVEFVDGRLSADSLSKTILFPISLKRNGEEKRFKVYADSIAAAFSGAAVLEYAYLPENDFTLTDSISHMRLAQGALCDGILSEYYFANKVFDLAQDFDSSYRSKLGLLKYKGKRLIVRQRGWQS